MKTIKCILLFILLGTSYVQSQNIGDTIVVQTFDYGMTYGQAWGPPRDTIAYFPNNPNLTFEKIIMSYSMRCKDDIVNTSGGNNVGCGEWDYSCHTYIHDSTRVDSLLSKISSHTINGFPGSIYYYSINPVYNYHYIFQQNVLILDSVLASPDTIIERTIIPNYGTLVHDSISIDTNIYWQSLSYTYDTSGNILSIDTTQIDGVINVIDLVYYKRYPMAFQIMSFVTPYGIGLDLGSQGKTWHFDLTDYAPVFKGPKRITVSGGGQWQEDMDIKFYFIVGTPPRDVINAQQIWRPQSKSYTSIMSDDVFEIRDVIMNPNATAYKIKTVITGHGQEGEFIPRTHFINLDGGPTEFSWQAWTECAENPIFPQGGTWIYDRAGWCPGMPSDVREDMISSLVSPGSSHSIDYGITTAAGSSNYWVSSQLISYGDPNFVLDAAIIDIVSPTNKVNYERKNPICSKPKIIIQNTGLTKLTSLEIEYWINNSLTKENFLWSGDLEFLETEEIELPDPANLWDNISTSNNQFHVEILNPNGSLDGYAFNNEMTSKFELPPTYPNEFALWFTTNAGVVNTFTQKSESSWEFFDNANNSIYTSGTLYSNIQYRDTLFFNGGCYKFLIYDADDDGFDFWANNDGTGMARFREIGASWLKTFDGDFGRSLYHEFIVPPIVNNIEGEIIDWRVFPNPAKESVFISGGVIGETKIKIYNNIGEKVLDVTGSFNRDFDKEINIEHFPQGIYYIKIHYNNYELIKKLIKI